MSRSEIPREQWANFFNEFTKQNLDKIVKIEVTDDEDYRIDYAESLPLKEVKLVPHNNGDTVVEVSAGASNSFTHSIDRTAIVIIEERNNTVKVLQIKSSLGRTLVIRFHPLDSNDDLM